MLFGGSSTRTVLVAQLGSLEPRSRAFSAWIFPFFEKDATKPLQLQHEADDAAISSFATLWSHAA